MKARYYIYRNLHTGGFSIKYKGKVIERLNYFTAFNCELKVSNKGRQRVLKNKMRNVHAFVVAEEYVPNIFPRAIGMQQINYNPFKNDSFLCNDKKVTIAKEVGFKDNKAYLFNLGS